MFAGGFDRGQSHCHQNDTRLGFEFSASLVDQVLWFSQPVWRCGRRWFRMMTRAGHFVCFDYGSEESAALFLILESLHYKFGVSCLDCTTGGCWASSWLLNRMCNIRGGDCVAEQNVLYSFGSADKASVKRCWSALLLGTTASSTLCFKYLLFLWYLNLGKIRVTVLSLSC